MMYLTIQGDTWDGIAFKQYGSERHMNLLMNANPPHIRTVIFSAGVELTIPVLPVDQADTLPPWKRED